MGEGRDGPDEWRNLTVTLPAALRARARDHRIASVLVLGAGVLAAAGCGSSSKSTSSSAAETTPAATTPATTSSSSSSATTPAPAPAGGAAASSLSDAANPEGQLKYEKSSLIAKAGKVTINFTNTSPLPHNLTIADASGATVGATPTFQGGSQKLSVTLKAGTYKFYCTVPGHRAAGMEGTLTVH
jgi:plastocyanin